MVTSSPFSWLNERLQSAANGGFPFQPPEWLVTEGIDRLTLLLNHVLQTEPEAMSRLRRHSGRVVRLKWRDFQVTLRATPGGLVERAAQDAAAAPDLNVHITENSPFTLAKLLMQSEKPPVHIEGDVQLAAEVNWLIDHVRWDIEEDLSKLIGDAPAHLVCSTLAGAAQMLKSFVSKATGGPGKPQA